MFDLGTSMDFDQIFFTYNNENYVFWFWKGDYLNLGIGAELGVYYGGPDYWEINKRLAMNMWMSLDYKGYNIFSRTDYTWWITGFKPDEKYIKANINSDQLTARYWIKLHNDSMYKQFRLTNTTKRDHKFRYHYYSFNNSVHITF